MVRKNSGRIVAFLLTCTYAVMLLAVSAAGGLQTPGQKANLDSAVHIGVAKATLLDIMTELSGKHHLSVAADGEPIAAPMDLKFDGKLREGLNVIAEHFDLTWSERGGAILFRKRFRDPRERPQTHPKEIRQSIRDVLIVLPAVPAADDHDVWAEALRRFAQTLTPAQVDDLKKGAHIRIDTLPPGQAEMVRRAVLLRGFGIPRGVWERLLTVLDNMAESSIVSNIPGDRRGPGVVHTLTPKGRPPVTIVLHASDRETGR